MAKSTVVRVTVALATLFAMLSAGSALAQPGVPTSNEHVPDVAAYWTPERMANAIPRDLVIDHRGLGYLRLPDGTLQPYGHQTAAVADRLTAVSSGSNPDAAVPRGKPDPGDSEPPDVSAISPIDEAVVSSPVEFAATVSDESGIKSVSFEVRNASEGLWQSFNPSPEGGIWKITITGFSPGGSYQWRVIAKDNGPKGGNITTTNPVTFTVGSGSTTTTATPPPTSTTTDGSGSTTCPTGVADANWCHLGLVDTAAGRIYFEMPSNAKRKGPWNGYVCSGTVVTDGTSDHRSIVITAAHCVYDDVNKAFARNVLFIPKQYQAGATDRNCLNDPLGCWKPSFGVVDEDWANQTWPANIPWDFAYYVFDDDNPDAHLVNNGSGQLVQEAVALDGAAGSLEVAFSSDDPTGNDAVTDALGYSYSQDPNFRYCSEPLATPSDEFATGAGSYYYRWLNSCDLSGGASGGPWLQPAGTGVGPIISVNSWGWSNQPGMAGPILNAEAQCLYDLAETDDGIVDLWGAASGDQGVIGTSCTGITQVTTP
jgi:hypothetical protein